MKTDRLEHTLNMAMLRVRQLTSEAVMNGVDVSLEKMPRKVGGEVVMMNVMVLNYG